MVTVIYALAWAVVVYSTGVIVSGSLSASKWEEFVRAAMGLMFFVGEGIILSIVH